MYFNYAFRQETCNHDEKMKKKESLMFIIKSLNITTKKWLSCALMISILTNASERMHEAHCFIDSEIEWNFIL